MKQNKYIHPRYSAARGKENEITAYVVCYPYLDEGVRHTITRNFPLKNFISPAAALMAAEKERDRIIKEVKKNCKQGSNITRALYFCFYGGRIIVTNGFTKKTKWTPPGEIKLASE